MKMAAKLFLLESPEYLKIFCQCAHTWQVEKSSSSFEYLIFIKNDWLECYWMLLTFWANKKSKTEGRLSTRGVIQTAVLRKQWAWGII